MSYEQLWAPWRLGYIKGDEPEQPKQIAVSPGADSKCFICRGLADDDDRENLLLARGEHAAVFLNRYPYNNGHLLVTPNAHKSRPDELSDAESLETQKLLAHYVSVLEQRMNAEGFNIGLNLGRTAGAGLPGHLHWHIVPRWSGDTNFMPVLAGIRVIPQSLEALWDYLHDAKS